MLLESRSCTENKCLNCKSWLKKWATVFNVKVNVCGPLTSKVGSCRAKKETYHSEMNSAIQMMGSYIQRWTSAVQVVNQLHPFLEVGTPRKGPQHSKMDVGSPIPLPYADCPETVFTFFDSSRTHEKKSGFRSAQYIETGKINSDIFASSAVISQDFLAFVSQLEASWVHFSACPFWAFWKSVSIFGFSHANIPALASRQWNDAVQT